MTLRQVFNATSRAARSAARAVRRDSTLAALVLVAVLLAAWTLLKWLRRRRWEGAASGPEDCDKKDKYWDEQRGKCMNPINCTSKGGNVVDGTCVGASVQKDCHGRGKWYDEEKKKCRGSSACTKKGGKVVDGMCQMAAEEKEEEEDEDEGSGVVTVFSDFNFKGQQRQFVEGDYPDLGTFGFNDSISSIQIPSNLKVTIYQKPNYGGKSLTFPSWNHGDLRNWSFKDNKYYNRDVCGDQSNTDCWNDSASSMKITTA